MQMKQSILINVLLVCVCVLCVNCYFSYAVISDRVFLYGDLSYLEIYKAPMHSESYHDCTTELCFVGWMYIFKIKFSWAVLVASRVHGSCNRSPSK